LCHALRRLCGCPHQDNVTADAACAALEAEDIRCWIAPRDIVYDMDFGEAIIDAIAGAKIMVLIFSSPANASPQVKREVERRTQRNSDHSGAHRECPAESGARIFHQHLTLVRRADAAARSAPQETCRLCFFVSGGSLHALANVTTRIFLLISSYPLS
jgi:TIR domain